jgi:hypothetical protein
MKIRGGLTASKEEHISGSGPFSALLACSSTFSLTSGHFSSVTLFRKAPIRYFKPKFLAYEKPNRSIFIL